MVTQKRIGRQERSLDLIANFVDGYAEGWYFAVGKCFRDELDIKYTERVEGGKRRMCWTQGPYFNFKEGYTIYNTPKAYEGQWKEALQHIGLAIEVIRSTPNQPGEGSRLNNGWVTFTLSEPNGDWSGLETIGQFYLTQNDFVDYLRTGDLDEVAAGVPPGEGGI